MSEHNQKLAFELSSVSRLEQSSRQTLLVKGSSTSEATKSITLFMVHGFLKAIWQVIKHLVLTPAGGSKRRAEQQAYERMLEEGKR